MVQESHELPVLQETRDSRDSAYSVDSLEVQEVQETEVQQRIATAAVVETEIAATNVETQASCDASSSQVQVKKWFGVITIFPEMFTGFMQTGMCKQGLDRELYTINLWQLRDFTSDRHQTVDDRPYGGGPGMLLKPEPLALAVEAAKQAALQAGFSNEQVQVILLSPQGSTFSHQASVELAQDDRAYIFVCGRYEGIDQRFIDNYVDQEWSIGDYVLTGGELGAMVMIDAIIRHIPGLLNHNLSAVEDSFAQGLLDCPHYTRPEVYQGQRVPQVLLSGNHQLIEEWRLQQALERSLRLRPDLIAKLDVSCLPKHGQRHLAMLQGKPDPFPKRQRRRSKTVTVLAQEAANF